ncbi:MAG: endonuclease domain-containing protein [Atopobiaceae bacterium]|jgi:very-short-patch-repair endonuclease|nr:endonuclease domain-containing protein [Atopobiaceae bacterium]
MPVFLADISSLARLQARRPRLATLGEALVSPLPTCAHDDAEARALFSSQRPDVVRAVSLGGGRPVDLLVPCPGLRGRSGRVSYRVWQGMVPPGSFRSLGPGVFACSPEFCFLLAMPRLSWPDRLRLGYSLCGYYPPADAEVGGTHPFRAPLTSVSLLGRYLACARGAYGANLARRVVRYLLDGSASPRETDLAIVLSLPARFGGYGLKGMRLNVPVEADARSRAISPQRRFILDEYFPESKTAVEYDGRQHGEACHLARDARRRDALLCRGISLVSVTDEQLTSQWAMEGVAALIAERCGQSSRTRARDPKAARIRLSLDLFGRA